MDIYFTVDNRLFLHIGTCSNLLKKFNNEEMFKQSLLTNLPCVYFYAEAIFTLQDDCDQFYISGAVKALPNAIDYSNMASDIGKELNIVYCDYSNTIAIKHLKAIPNGTRLKNISMSYSTYDYMYNSFVLLDDLLEYCLELGVEVSSCFFTRLFHILFNENNDYVDATFNEKIDGLESLIEFNVVLNLAKKFGFERECIEGKEIAKNLLSAAENIEKLFSNKDQSIKSAENESRQTRELFEDDNIPNNLYFAYCLYIEVWKNLPKDMNKPTKAELTNHLNKIGIKEQTTIDAIIKTSLPNGMVLGGKQKSNLKPWNIKGY